MKLSELRICLPYTYMTVRQLAVLFYLKTDKGQKDSRLRVIADNLSIQRPSMTRAFDGLCRMKLIKRVRGDDDARDVYAVLTPKGNDFVLSLSC